MRLCDLKVGKGRKSIGWPAVLLVEAANDIHSIRMFDVFLTTTETEGARAQALAIASVRKTLYFQEYCFAGASASSTIQAAPIFYLDKLVVAACAIYTGYCLLFWHTFLHRHFPQSLSLCFLDLSCSLLPLSHFLKGRGGRRNLAHSLLHLSLRIC